MLNDREQAAYDAGFKAAQNVEPISKYPTYLNGGANIKRAFKQGYLDGLRAKNNA